MEPITRKEMYLAKICGDYSGTVPEPVTRIDYYMAYAAGTYNGPLPRPIVQQEFYWAYICGATDIDLPEPVTRVDMYLDAICGGMILLPEPITLEEIYLAKIAKQSQYVSKTAAGRTIVLTDSFDAPFEDLKVYGHTTQKTTTGAQLLDIDSMLNDCLIKNDDGSYSILKTETDRFSNAMPVNLPAGTSIRFDADVLEYNGTYDKQLQITLTSQTVNIGQTITLSTDATSLRIYQDAANSVGTYTKFKNAMLSIRSVAVPWEPYTGGKPSPNPDYPQELVSAGDKGEINISICGKNALDGTPIGERINRGVTFSASEDGFGTHLTGTSTDIFAQNTIKQYHSIDATPGTYMFSTKVVGTTGANIYAIIAKDGRNKFSTSQGAVEVKIEEGHSYGMFVVVSESGATMNCDIYAQLELGTEATAWEPYTKQTLILSTPNGLPGIPVSSGGNYVDENGQQWVADYRDWERGVDVKRIKTKILDGTENVSGYIALTNGNGYAGWVNAKDRDKKIREVLCSHLKFAPEVQGAGMKYGTMIGAYNNTPIWMTFSVELETAIDAKNYLKDCYEAGTPVTIQYVLATPIETAIPAEELAVYKALHTNYPTTTIMNDEDCWMEVGYKAKPVSQYNEAMTLEYLKGE